MIEFLEYVLSANEDADTDMIEKAYVIAEKAHEGQLRKSGEDYFIHPQEVAKILVDLRMDDATITAGLLHDVIEDTNYGFEYISKEISEEVAFLVDGVSKLGNLKFENKEEAQAENLRKMFLAISKDIRVLIIKLADRLHNMRTIQFMPPEKRKEKSNETLEIYAPLADRLGISTIKFELEEISFRQLHPAAYERIKAKLKNSQIATQEFIDDVIDQISSKLALHNIECEIDGRLKHIYSIYKKMEFQKKGYDEIFDITAIRIMVDSIKDCYGALGVVHTMWRPLPGRFKDYIAMPKPNMYQSLHTTVIGDKGIPFEIQIRTVEMHQIAEYGIAAHWKYKEQISGAYEEDEKLSWLRQMLEWQQDLKDSKEFVDTLKMDLFSNQVFVFSPQGDVIELPAGSSPIDFAYKIHSEVGNKCIGAKVNGKMVPINYELENGNIVEIVTSNHSKGPSIDWLKIVKSNHAKNKIRQWLKKENRVENTEKGRELLEKYMKKKGHDPKDVLKNAWLSKVAKSYRITSIEDLYTAIGFGGVPLNKVGVALLEHYKKEKYDEIKKEINVDQIKTTKVQRTRKSEASGVKVEGLDSLLIRFARCCSPVPGDDIIGFITKGRGITVHRTDCVNIINADEDSQKRFIKVDWDEELKENMNYESDITMIGESRAGLLAEISKKLDDIGVSLRGINANTGNDGIVNINLVIAISDARQVETTIKKMRSIQGILDVYRTSG